MSILESAEFWDKVCNGDKESIDRLCSIVIDRIRFVARKYSQDEDIVQEVIGCAWTKSITHICRKRLDDPSGVRAFFGWAAVKCASSILKRLRDEAQKQIALESDPSVKELSTTDMWIRLEELEAVRNCLPELKKLDDERDAANPGKRLPQRFRVIYERYFARPDDSPVTFAELATMLSESPTTLQNWQKLAFKQLRPCIKQRMGRTS